MSSHPHKAIAVVGVGAVLPDAPDAPTFWQNIRQGRYSISDVPEDRWRTADYWDPDPKVAAKTYSKIGGWVRDFEWEPLAWRLPIPPKVGASMDLTQKWSVVATREALADYGYPERPLDTERTAVILGNAMAGDRHYLTSLRVNLPEYARALKIAPGFAALPEESRRAILEQLNEGITGQLPEITEDTMPGELANIIAGRVANLYDLHGPNFVCDAACASAIAAISAAIEGLDEDDYDAVLTGGIDANMSAATFTKFCKIGALSATGTRPYADGADGFVMGEGAAVFLLKRLADAERDGDSIYAVIRGIGGSSDGRGKGITAPNPVGQRLAVERAWKRSGVEPNRATLVEGHGTSTKVGDVVEVESLGEVFRGYGFAPGTLPLGSVKSNIGHLKGAAGAAGLLKALFALRDKELPPSIGFERPNPNIDFDRSPFRVNTELRPWEAEGDNLRSVGVSAFGFGGTNFHAVLEEYVPGRSGGDRQIRLAVGAPAALRPLRGAPAAARRPLRGALLIGADSQAELVARLAEARRTASAGTCPPPQLPATTDLRAEYRLAIDYDDAEELTTKAGRAQAAFETGQKSPWTGLAAQGVYRGRGEPGKVAFLFSGQGSQYPNMLRELRDREPLVAEVFAEADEVTEPLLGRPLTDYIFVDAADEKKMAQAKEDLRQTEITQPAVLAVDVALCRLLGAHGIEPDMVMGHSLGEYGALVAAGSLDFAGALLAVSARGHEMTKVSVEDKGKMAAIFAPLEKIEETLAAVDGHVVVANVNSFRQAVIGGASGAVDEAVDAFRRLGHQVAVLPVSHAFHTSIVSEAGVPLTRLLRELDLRPPRLPLVANVTGDFYPDAEDCKEEMVDLLGRQVASPVQFVKGLDTLYREGARVFLELGPKRALHGFVTDVLGDKADVVSLYSNHPKVGDVRSFNHVLCGCWAAGLGPSVEPATVSPPPLPEPARRSISMPTSPPMAVSPAPAPVAAAGREGVPYQELGRLFADFLDKGFQLYSGGRSATPERPVVISGAALGLPGTERVFDDANVGRLLRGEQLIGEIPAELKRSMVDRNIVRLVKDEKGGGRFETIGDTSDVIKLAARKRKLELDEEFGFPKDRLAALDVTSQLAIGAGIDALRDAGIPLVLRYKTTSKGTQLPDRWGLADTLRDETGVIFGSAFPGIDSFAGENRRYYTDRARRARLAELEELRARAAGANGDQEGLVRELDSRIAAVRAEIDEHGYTFDRRFLFQLLSMGHSQFAELIGARGPNTQLNAACATTTHAVGLAEDWIRQGRCRRVVIVCGDDVTSDEVLPWIGSGFLASGAAATDERVEDAAIPFDRRRHGMLIGMGGAAIVVEAAEAVAERGIQPICEVLGTESANSAYHGTRLNVDHICARMEAMVARAEGEWGIRREEMAAETVFVSHETYTPARGGSAQAEVDALRRVFGAAAERIVVANTKGFTGHPMAVGIEDVVAIKILETGLVPPVANFKEVDPDLGRLNLSRGGSHPVRYALRLGAGFGSQLSFSLIRWVPTADGRRPSPEALGYQTRIVDPTAWRDWLERTAGHAGAEIEVAQRTLRIRDRGIAADARSVSSSQAPEAARVTASPPEETTAPVGAPVPGVEDPVQKRVLAIVAEQTGYPPEMLDLDLDLEADLGIDTVKQAETFAAIREGWDIPRDDDLVLRDYPTLAHAIQFVYDKRPDLEKPSVVDGSVSPAPAAATVDEPAAPVAATAATADAVRDRVLAIVAEQTGYPPEMLDLDLDLEADLGIDTVKQAETFAAIREGWDIPRDDELVLRDYPTLAHAIQFVYDKRPDLEKPSVVDGSVSPAPAAATATTAAAPVAPVAATAATADAVRDRVLAIVAEQTGYPPEMLDLDLDLEADLGIDTVKQAETFAAIREGWDIPRDDELVLRDYPTLAHAIQFVYDKRPDLVAGQPAAAGRPGEAVESGGAEPSHGADAAAEPVEVPRRVPLAVLRPPLEACLESGVALEAGARVIVMPDRGGVAQALAEQLSARGVEVLALESEGASAIAEQAVGWLADGPVAGVYWLPALDVEKPLAEMAAAEWKRETDRRIKRFYTLMRALYGAIGESGTFLVAGTRLGGLHGYGEDGATAPLGGAVTGFAKSFKRERLEAQVKAVDFAPGGEAGTLAERLIAETLRDPGAVEVGYRDEERWTLTLAEQEAGAGVDDARVGIELNKDTVFLVTGAAGSIVSAIVGDLATASGGVFHLLDLAIAPDPDDADLERFVHDREGLKLELFERLKASGERATPAKVDRRLADLERRRAALDAVQAVERAGGRAVYHQVDLLDAEAIAEAVARVRSDHGGIDVLLHAGGLEISHMLPDKEPAEFDRVFDVKAAGWFHLIQAIGDMPLGAVVAFSSIAGRFGNAGQADYASANDLLCKCCSAMRRTHPETRAIAIDWTAWGGIGMATRGSIPKMMRQAGIDMLPPEAGIPIVRYELLAGSRGEVLIGQGLGGMLDEVHESGGLDRASLAARLDGPMTAEVEGMGIHSGLTVGLELDPAEQPFLHDHQIDGTPVLPGVMGLEGFAELAQLLFPEHRVLAVENARFRAPFKFYRREPRRLSLSAQFRRAGDEVVADCRLIGRRSLPGQAEPVVTEHFTADVRLGTGNPQEAARQWPDPASGPEATADDIYRVYFHGPAYRVVERAWAQNGLAVGVLPEKLPANHHPADIETLIAPRLIELCLQTAGLWDLGHAGRYGLPEAIDRVRCLVRPDGEKRLCAVARPNAKNGTFDAWVLDEDGTVYVAVKGYRTVVLPSQISDQELEPLRQAMTPA